MVGLIQELEVPERFAGLTLFRRVDPHMSPWRVICWWELRRIPFNLVIGATGIFVLVTLDACGAIAQRYLGEPIGVPDPPMVAVGAILLYGVMANVLYTGGWASEILVTHVWKENVPDFGPAVLFVGFSLSVGLTLLPAIAIAGMVAVQLALHAVSP